MPKLIEVDSKTKPEAPQAQPDNLEDFNLKFINLVRSLNAEQLRDLAIDIRKKLTGNDPTERSIAVYNTNTAFEVFRIGLGNKTCRKACIRLFGAIRRSDIAFKEGYQDLQEKCTGALFDALLNWGAAHAMRELRQFRGKFAKTTGESFLKHLDEFSNTEVTNSKEALPIMLSGIIDLLHPPKSKVDRALLDKAHELLKSHLQPFKDSRAGYDCYNYDVNEMAPYFSLACGGDETEGKLLLKELISSISRDSILALEAFPRFMPHLKEFVHAIVPPNAYFLENKNERESYSVFIAYISKQPGGPELVSEILSGLSENERFSTLKLIRGDFRNASYGFTETMTKVLNSSADSLKENREYAPFVPLLKHPFQYMSELKAQLRRMEAPELMDFIERLKDYDYSGLFPRRDMVMFSSILLQACKSVSPLKSLEVMQSWINIVRDFESSHLGHVVTEFLRPLHYHLKKHGLRGREFLHYDFKEKRLAGALVESGPDEDLNSRLVDTLRVISQIDQEMPGSAKLLRNLSGIKIFGRYPSTMLLDQVKYLTSSPEERLKMPPPLLVFNPIADWNGAFYRNYLVSRLYIINQRHHPAPVLFMESEDKFGLLRNHLRIFNSIGRIEYAVISGHGGTDGLTLGPNAHLLTTDLKERSIRKLVRKVYADSAQIVLDSCFGGAKEALGETVVRGTAGKGITITSANTSSFLKMFDISRSKNGKMMLKAAYATDVPNDARVADTTTKLVGI